MYRRDRDIRARIYAAYLRSAVMATWHRLGDATVLRARIPFSVDVERHRIAVFLHGGRLTAISDICNHKGGPLSEGRLRGEFVTCPWHGWEYSVVTGKGPAGYDEEQVPVYALEERPDGVYVQIPPIAPRKLLKHKPSHLLAEHPKEPGSPCRVLAISTTAMDEGNPRFSTSDALLDHAIGRARELGADTQLIKLRSLDFKHCEGNYSKASHACTWPVRDHGTGPGRPIDRGLRRTGPLVRRRRSCDADPLGQRLGALLQ